MARHRVGHGKTHTLGGPLPVKWGADFLRGSNWEPRVMTRRQAERYAQLHIPKHLKKAGFTCHVSESDPEMHGGHWYRINCSK